MNVHGINKDRRIADMERILALTRLIGASKDLDGLLARIVGAVSELLDAERVSLWVVDPGSDRMFTRVAQGDGIGTLEIPLGAGIAGTVGKDGLTVNIPDAYQDSRFDPSFDRKTGFKTRSILCMALKNATDDVVGVAQALNKRGFPSFDEYDETLLDILCSQTGVVLERMRMRDIEFTQRKMKADLELAQTIQKSLLPDGAPSFERLDVAGFNRPADETGGDYYDFVPVNGGELGIIVGDVSGHGLPSALVMASARAMIRAMLLGGMTPDDALGRANELLNQDLEDDRFMSMLIAVIDPETLAMRFSSAGHEAPLVRRANGQYETLDGAGCLLGMFNDSTYDSYGSIQLNPGDIVAFYTDGVFEAMNSKDEAFGFERLRTIISDTSDLSADSIVIKTIAAVDQFVSGRAQKDDITLIIAKMTR
ncbi:MAG: SpoIIE family protein phosphatase [Planctomycetota bacterium]